MTNKEIYDLFSDELHLCGCGSPETAVIFIRDLLKMFPLHSNRPAFEKFLPIEGAQHLILGVLNDADLIEHGGSVGGSWLTSRGIKFRDSLNLLNEDEIDKMMGTSYPDDLS